MDILTDFQCRKCTLITTLQSMTQELDLISGKDQERAQNLMRDIGRIKDALQSNVEAVLVSGTPFLIV